MKNTTKRSTLEQAGGCVSQRGETCRFRCHRPRPRIGTATIGRQEVGILSILHGLTIRVFSQMGPVSVGQEINFPTTDGSVDRTPTQTACTDVHSVSAHTLKYDHISSREHGGAQGRTAEGCTHWCL